MTVTVTIHRARLHATTEHGPQAVAACTLKPRREMGPLETVTLTERVNCPDCLGRLWWIRQNYDLTLTEHVPASLAATA